ncbi:hypothetical protein BHE74_00052582 [Ensete ventricosum]|nr:hypothetical protein GW17_00015238 [Ensete ventricosum]RWW41905.1 hypothetical protein BHE74_00052582 [Ensete ventricosum]
MIGQDQAWASGRVQTMQWDLVGSSLGDSLKELGSSLGKHQEIARRRLEDSLQECRKLSDWREEQRLDRPYPRNRAAASRCQRLNCPGRRVNRPYLVFKRLTVGKSPRLGG